MRDYCEELMSNETSCTTASSEGEEVARNTIESARENRRKVEGEEEVKEDEFIVMQLERYNPLIHKTSF